MNVAKFLNVILALALLILIVKGGKGSFSCGKEKALVSSLNEKEIVLKNIHSRKSVRSFTDEKISKEDIETLLKAGMAAPTANNQQPWDFIVITDRNLLNEFAEFLDYGKMLKEAYAAIVVTGDKERTLPDIEDQYWIQDCSAASENILLAVEAMDLGAVWLGIHPMPDRISFAKEKLNLPENIRPLNIIAIGHPKGNTKPKKKWNEERVHLDRW